MQPVAIDDASREWLERRDAEWKVWFAEQKAASDRFHRELLERHAGITESMIAALQESTAQLVAEIADQRAQIRANTQAVLRALDRLGPEPA